MTHIYKSRHSRERNNILTLNNNFKHIISMLLSRAKKMTAAVICLIIAVSCTGFAAGVSDTDNHIACDNASLSVPTDGPVRLDETYGWVRSGKNLLTNFYSMYQPEVIYIKEQDVEGGYPYRMWFFAWAYTQENDATPIYPGYPGGDAIFTARARSLEGPWEVYSLDYSTDEFFWDTKMDPFYWYPVVTCDDKWYDSWHVGDPSVVYMDGTFYMAYSAMGCDEDGIPSHKPKDTDGNASCIMGAVSTDGIHWTRSEKPLLVWKGEKGFNEKDSYDKYYGGHQRPSLMFEDGVWKMWYDYRYNRLGYAECRGDFLTGSWKESATDLNGLGLGVDFDVVKIGDIYYAYGDPYVNWVGIKDTDIPYYPDDSSLWSQRQIVEYQSRDGLSWTATGYFLPDEGYDAIQIPQVFLDHKENRVYIFYATQRGKRGGKTYDWRWDNIRCMSRDAALFASAAAPVYTPAPTPAQTVKETETEPAATTKNTALPQESAETPDKPGKNGEVLPVIILAGSILLAIGAVFAVIAICKKRNGK